MRNQKLRVAAFLMGLGLLSIVPVHAEEGEQYPINSEEWFDNSVAERTQAFVYRAPEEDVAEADIVIDGIRYQAKDVSSIFDGQRVDFVIDENAEKDGVLAYGFTDSEELREYLELEEEEGDFDETAERHASASYFWTGYNFSGWEINVSVGYWANLIGSWSVMNNTISSVATPAMGSRTVLYDGFNRTGFSCYILHPFDVSALQWPCNNMASSVAVYW